MKDWTEFQICQLLLSKQLTDISQLLSYTNSATICLRERKKKKILEDTDCSSQLKGSLIFQLLTTLPVTAVSSNFLKPVEEILHRENNSN